MASPGPFEMPTTDIKASSPLADGHGLKPLTSPRKTPGSSAPPADHQTPTQDVADQDRPQGPAEAGKEKGAGGGEAAGPPTPMRPQAAARRAETSPEGRSAEEDNAPPAVAAQQEAPLQPEDTQAEQCDGQGQANGLPNGKPAPARPLSFKRQGSSSSVSNQQPMNGRSSPSRNGHTSPPPSGKDAYVHAWRRDATPKRGPYDSHGFNGQQHSDSHQGMSWSGNAWGKAPRPNVRGPAPPTTPYPGDVPPVRYQQGTAHARYYPQAGVTPPHAVNEISVGGQPDIPQEPAWLILEGHTYFTVWNPFTHRWAWNMAPRAQVNEAHVGSPPQGAGYHPGFTPQQNWAPQQHMAPQAFHQEYSPHQPMAQPQPAFGSAPTHFSTFNPDNTPTQHFAGTHGGSDYTGAYHGQQPRHGNPNRNRQGPLHRRSSSLPEASWPEAARLPAPARHRRQVSLPDVEAAPRAPKPSHARRSSLGSMLPSDRPSKAPPDKRPEPPPRRRGHRRILSLPIELLAGRQQGGGGPDRKPQHRRTQSSRPTEMGSQGSGGSSNGRRQSPSQRRVPDPADMPQGTTLQDVLKDLVGCCDNQQGSRHVQELLIRATPEEVRLFAEGFVKHPQAMDVINDSFGNYVAQRLVQRADVAQRMTISDTLLKPAMLELSGHQYGCRVIQAAIEHLPTIKDKCALAGLLKGQVLKYVLDSHGNHVVQCCFRHIRDREGDDSIDFMLEELSQAAISLPAEGEQSLCQERQEAGFIAVAKHVYGCRVVQRIMESCCLPGWKAKICHEVVQHASELAVTCYGNYVIQSCLALCSDEARELAFVDLLGQMDKLPFHKNASNVYERLLGVADEKSKKENLPPPRSLTTDQLERFYKRVVNSPGKEARPLIRKLIPHQFGNYVAGACTMAMKADRDKLDNIVQNIRAELESVELDPKATKQLKERIKSLLEKTAKLKLKDTSVACSTIGSTTTGSSTSGA